MSRLAVRTADNSIAKLMADNNWTQVNATTWTKAELTINMDIGEQEIPYGNDWSNPDYRDYGVVTFQASNVTVHVLDKPTSLGEYGVSLEYNGVQYESEVHYEDLFYLIDRALMYAYFDDDLMEVLVNEEEDRLNEEEYDPTEDEYYEKLMEGCKMGMMKQRMAADDVAQQLIAHDWTQVDEHTLTSDYDVLEYWVGEVEVFLDPEGARTYNKDFGMVELEVEDLTLVMNADGGAHIKFTYDRREYEGDLNKKELADLANDGYLAGKFNNDFDWFVTTNVVNEDDDLEPPDEGREYDKYIDSYEYRDEPGNRYYEGQQHGRLRRTAMGDVAKLLIDNGWEPEADMENAWFKAKTDACCYVGEWGPRDYGEVWFTATDVMITLNDDNTAKVVFTYDQVEYDGMINDANALEEFIVEGVLPDEFNENLLDPLAADAEGSAIDWAEYMYVDR